jgi:hypothetical protein
MYVVLDGSFEAVLGFCEGYSEALALSLEIECRNQGFDFEAVWKIYPRKIAKKSGILWLKKNVRSRSRYDLLMQAVNNYAAYCDARSMEEQFIQHFSTWVKKFEDWTTESIKETFVPPQQISTRPVHLDIEKLLGGV